MDKNMDYNFYSPYMGPTPDMNFDPAMADPILNPAMQYEQGYMYYRYLISQLDYKMKLKEYDKLFKNDSRGERRIE